jgi:DNA-binding LacI/PurR family transcriptional regulator
MKTGRTGTLAVIVPDITNPYFASMVRAVERTARESDHLVLLADTSEHPREEVRSARTLARDVDGFVVLSPRRLHRELDALGGTPAVFVNRPVARHGSVLLRSAPAVGEVLVHLASLGHRAVVFLGGPAGSWAAGERRTAVHTMAKTSGLDVTVVDAPEPTFDAAFEAVPKLLERPATAVIAFNDQMALGVMAGLSRQGVAVPDAVSVVGFDDVPMAAMVAPPLTTIALPTEEAGTRAVELLRTGGTTTIELAGTLVLRESTGRVMTRRATAGGDGGPQPSGAGHA